MWLIGLGGEARIFEDTIVPDPLGSVVIPRLQRGRTVGKHPHHPRFSIYYIMLSLCTSTCGV